LRVMTILGTRPEIIRLSRVIPLLDAYAEHVIIHTGQNIDYRLNEFIFHELGIREPNYRLRCEGSGFGGQVGQILASIEPLLHKHQPDRVLVLGDTNSGLASMVARRLGIQVHHMEAGNRCYDFRSPEEANRRIIDHVSSVLMPFTNRSRENLLREGIDADRIFVTGNPIKEVMDFYARGIDESTILDRLELKPGEYFLATLHRAENVDVEMRLRSCLDAFSRLSAEYGFPIICSLHPRTRSKMMGYGIVAQYAGVKFLEPLGMLDFSRLERSAACLLSDSGSVQEEGCILRVPTVTLRDFTERPETIECGSNILAGCDSDAIVNAVKLHTREIPRWQTPAEYRVENVADCASRIILTQVNSFR
jgi:UDP-N-acetylglucosamine 2-epimerase (non-hydrolysing)